MAGITLATQGVGGEVIPPYFSVKEAVFPFIKFPGADTILGPEMKSTGEVMGVSDNFGQAYAKAQMSASVYLPRSGTAFISVNQHDKKNVIRIADRLHQLGFRLIATRGTATALEESGIPVESVYKVNEGRPHIVDMIKSGKVDLILNTPLGKSSFFDERAIRRAAMQHGVPCITTLSGGAAVASGIAALQRNKVDVLALQEYHEAVKSGG
jgi:carbamoyl-phosphate synthase large subunit